MKRKTLLVSPHGEPGGDRTWGGRSTEAHHINNARRDVSDKTWDVDRCSICYGAAWKCSRSAHFTRNVHVQPVSNISCSFFERKAVTLNICATSNWELYFFSRNMQLIASFRYEFNFLKNNYSKLFIKVVQFFEKCATINRYLIWVELVSSSTGNDIQLFG
jgi:hypothetical protein